MRLVFALGVVLSANAAGSGQDAHRGISAEKPTGSDAIARDGLVASYDMSSLTEDGRLRDFSGNAHHGTFTAGTAGMSENGNGYRVFGSVDHRVHIEEHEDFDLDGPLTIAARMRVDELGLHQHAVACDDTWALWVTPDNRYRLGDTHGGGWSTAPGAVERGAWRDVVAVLKGTRGSELAPDTVAIFVDGELAEAERHLRTDEAREVGRWSPQDLFPDDACYIGFESHQGNEAHQSMPFMGAIDELLIFARAWSEAEVRAFSSR